MRKLRNNQSGFGAVEGILIVAVVVLLGVVGYMVYKNHSKVTNNAVTTTSNRVNTPTPAKATTPAPDPYAGWQSYTGHSFTVKYPPQWTNIDPFGDRQDLSEVVFGTHTVAAGGGEQPGTSAFDIHVFHKGYDICDCNPTQYVDGNTDLTHFIRAMNGLLPDDLFSQVQKQTKTIDGVEALKFKGGNFDTPWTMKVGSNIYQFEYLQGKNDVDSQTLQQYFDKFLISYHNQ